MTLPQGWAEATIGEAFSINPKHPADTDRNQSVSFVPMPAVDEHFGAIVGAADRKLSEIWTGYTHFADGDVIFAKITPCMENGKAAIACNLTNGMACGSTEFYVFRPENGVSADYLWRYLRQQSFRDEAETHMSGAVGQRRVPRDYLEQHSLPLPPEAEQRRIVAKLDALTARLARTRAELDRVPVLAARLRSQALGVIFDIQSAELAGIAVVSVGDVAEISSGYGFPKHFQGKTEGLYPFAKVSDISQAVTKQGGLLTSAANYVDRDDLKQLRAKPVSTGSTVFAKIGEALRLNRRALAQCDVILDNNCMALTPTAKLNPEYLFYFMQTVDLAPFAVATTVPSVRRGDVAGLQLPLPEPERQAELVEIIKSTFARADRLEAEATRARALLDRLESALLAKAFRGELVPQDPNDEPAQTLLDRIRTQRAAAPKAKRGRAAKVAA